jgi:AAA family ATP:ADP antiporter
LLKRSAPARRPQLCSRLPTHNDPGRSVVNDLIARLFNIKRGELPLALLSALFFFCVLCGYYFLRPVREALGVSRSMDDLRWLFVGSSIASLVAVLAFGGIVNRFDRRRFIPLAYLFVIVCLVVFASLLIVDAARGGGLIGTDAGTGFALAVGYTFFVWLTVINLFVNSVFWAFMVDLYDLDQGKRMFAFIGVGGTLGAIAGSMITEAVAGVTDSVYLPAGLMLAGAVLFGCAIAAMLALDRMAQASEHSRLGKRDAPGASVQAPPASRSEARFWDGVTAVASSPYLLGVGLFIMLLTVSNTLLYFTQANVVLERSDTFSQRLESFAQLNMLTQTMALLTQVFITTHLIKRFGVGLTLSLMPLILVAGFAALAVWPIFAVFAMFQALFRAAEYATTRPARETLFSVIPVAQKYQAKPVIDVVLYRFGDVAGTGLDRALVALGAGLAGVAAASVPFAAVWAALALALGRAQQLRAGRAAAARNAD